MYGRKDWDADEVSAFPAGLTARWNTSNTTAVIVANALAPKGKALRITRSSNNRAVYSDDAGSAASDRNVVKQRALIQLPTSFSGYGSSTPGLFWLVARASGTSSETGYAPGVARPSSGDANASLRWLHYISGSATQNNITPSNQLPLGDLYWLELLIDGSDQTFSVYAFSDVALASPILTENRSNTAITADGWVGIGGFTSVNDSGGGEQWLMYEVATGTDTLPPLIPEGVPTVTNVTEATTSIEVTYNTDDAWLGATVEYRIDGGAWAALDASPATISGLTAGTTYNTPGLELRSVNAAGASITASSPEAFTTSASGHSATGALNAGSAQVSGSAATDSIQTFTATGALVAGSSLVAGNAKRDVPALVTDLDGSNVHQTNTTLTVTGANALLVEVAFRSAMLTGTNGSGWRHGLFALEGAEGWDVTVRWPRTDMDRNTQTIHTGWVSLRTTDYETWTQAPSRTLVGGSTGYIECTFTNLPAGQVAIATQPLGRNSDAATFRTELLTTHSSVADPAASADVNGVFFTSPAETDDLSRAVGGNEMYAVKLAWGGATNDGGPKRKLVMWAGMHAAGENTSWISFRAAVRWMLTSAEARAVSLRANWDVYLYFNVTPNGIRAGHRRHNPDRATDPNRDIGVGALAETGALVTAVLADTGGSADALFSWHGYMGDDGAAFIAGSHSPVPQAAQDFISIGEPIFGVASIDYTFTANGTDSKWGYETLGAKVSFAAEVWQRGPTSAENYEFVGEAWVDTLAEADAQQLFYTPPFVATGALSAQPALVAGAASIFRLHSATGDPQAQPAAVSGSASRFRAHASSGDLQAQSAAVNGSASRTRVFAASGALAASRASVAGAATLRRLHAASGALESGESAVSGEGERTGAPTIHTATGAAASQSAAVNGSASRVVVTHSATGSITATGATVDGASARSRAHAAEGAVQAGPAVMAGSAERTGAILTYAASGALQAGSSVVTGSARAVTTHSAVAELVCGSAIVTGRDVDSGFQDPALRRSTFISIPVSRDTFIAAGKG